MSVRGFVKKVACCNIVNFVFSITKTANHADLQFHSRFRYKAVIWKYLSGSYTSSPIAHKNSIFSFACRLPNFKMILGSFTKFKERTFYWKKKPSMGWGAYYISISIPQLKGALQKFSDPRFRSPDNAIPKGICSDRGDSFPRWRGLIDSSLSKLSLLECRGCLKSMGGAIPQIATSKPGRFVCDNQHLELQPEADWQLVQLT